MCAVAVATPGHDVSSIRAWYQLFADVGSGRVLTARGIGGVRVWPHAPPTSIMDADGHIDPAVVARLLTLVDEAAARGMVVDLTFHREAIECPSSDWHVDNQQHS